MTLAGTISRHRKCPVGTSLFTICTTAEADSIDIQEDEATMVQLTDEQAELTISVLEVVIQKGLALTADVNAVKRAGLEPGEIGTSVAELRQLQEVLRGR
jgi:hypothetical protein